MTPADYKACEPILADLLARQLIASFKSTSWSTPAGPDYAWEVRSTRVRAPLTFSQPFTEDSLLITESIAFARQQHTETVEAVLWNVKETLYHDLGVLYRLRLQGRDLPVPEQITIKGVIVDLRVPPTVPSPLSPAIP